PAAIVRTTSSRCPFFRTVLIVEPLPIYATPLEIRTNFVMPGIAKEATSCGGSNRRSYKATPYPVASQRSLPSTARSNAVLRNCALRTGLKLHCGSAGVASSASTTTNTREGIVLIVAGGVQCSVDPGLVKRDHYPVLSTTEH